MSRAEKPLAWLHGRIKSPPFSAQARLKIGFLLGRVQRGESLGMPHSRPMPIIGARSHELRIVDESATWRIIYRTDPDVIVIVDVFSKKSLNTPTLVIEACKKRLREYDRA